MIGTPTKPDITAAELQVVEPYSPWQDFLKRFVRNKPAIIAFWMLVTLAVVALSAKGMGWTGLYWPYDPVNVNPPAKLQPPSGTHPLGTDNLGRDVLSRMVHGTPISLTVGLIAVAVSVTIGILVGSLAGYFGGIVDSILMRFVDMMMCFPTFFLILTVVALLKPSIYNIIIVIGVTSWTGTARFVRAEFLSLRQRDFVMAAVAGGLGSRRIIFRHILPNSLAPVAVSAVLGIAGAILTEASLSFLGFGVPPPAPTWGNILSDGKVYILDAWWLIVFPGLAIFVTTLSFYLVGEGMREALDPRLRVTT
jgi:peptide/nickel transport system permease protein